MYSTYRYSYFIEEVQNNDVMTNQPRLQVQLLYLSKLGSLSTPVPLKETNVRVSKTKLILPLAADVIAFDCEAFGPILLATPNNSKHDAAYNEETGLSLSCLWYL